MACEEQGRSGGSYAKTRMRSCHREEDPHKTALNKRWMDATEATLRHTLSLRNMSLRAGLWIALLVVVAMTVPVGGSDDRPIEDPRGDAEVPWVDIRHVYVEHKEYDVVRISMDLEQRPPYVDLGTGGALSMGYYYRVDFDLVDWNGSKIGDRNDQYVALIIGEAMVTDQICIWDDPDSQWSVCLRGGGHGEVMGARIRWEFDIADPPGDNRVVGRGYHLKNVSAFAQMRGMPLTTDRAPDSGYVNYTSPPKTYDNVRTSDDREDPTEDCCNASAVPDMNVQISAGRGEAALPVLEHEPEQLALGIVVLTSIIAGLGRLAYKVGRFRLMHWLLLGFFYSRIRRDSALENDRRAAIYGLVQESPGITFTEIKRRLKMGSGALVHHLGILNRQGFVRCLQEGFRTRVYLRGAAADGGPYLTRVQKELLAVVTQHPGIAQKHIAKITGLPRQSLRYHVRCLERMGKIRVRPDGRWRRHYTV